MDRVSSHRLALTSGRQDTKAGLSPSTVTPALVSSVEPAASGVCLVLGMRGMRALASCACSCSTQVFCMLAACVLHALGCSCSGVCLRLCAYFMLVWCMLGFCMLPACSVHVFDMPTGVCVRLWVCLVLGWCMSLASACFLLVAIKSSLIPDRDLF